MMRKLILSALLIWGLTGFTCAVVSLQGGSVVVELPLFDATPTQEIIPTSEPLPALAIIGTTRNVRGCGSLDCAVIDEITNLMCVAFDPTVIEVDSGWVWLQIFDGRLNSGAGWVAVKQPGGTHFVRFYDDAQCSTEIGLSLP